ncbi:MAG: polymerase subunit alpha, partial [Friedmanniella sp.]|nr:polymerase subunit alpha [Friedmanniella sp.]
MGDPFVHLRVASGYSLQFGASHPSTLVERAAEHEMDVLALTDRDGLYGAVRFAKACLRHHIAPVIGVDLALEPSASALPGPDRGPRARRPSGPARGGTLRADRPRVTVLPTGRTGWAALCRLVSATHLTGDRGDAVATADLITGWAAEGQLVVVLGADSDVGLALADGRAERGAELLRAWQRRLDPTQLVLAVTHHRAPGRGAGSVGLAGRMLALADREGIPAVLTNMVRMADRHLAPTVDVLDAARRLVALNRRHVSQVNAEGYLKSGKEMQELADEVARYAGRGERGGVRLLAQTRALAVRCALDPFADLGLGETHLPELSVLGRPGSSGAAVEPGSASGRAEALAQLRARCEVGISARFGRADDRVLARLEAELDVVDGRSLATYFLTVADVVDLIRGRGIRCAARGSGAGSLVNYLLGISGVDPLRHGLLMERFLSRLRQSLPDIDLDVESARRPEAYEAILDRFGGDRVACVAMLDTYRVRHAIRDVGAALSLPPGEIDAIAKAFPHIRARDARAALRDLPELRALGLGERRMDLLFSLAESLDGLPRHIALHPCGVLLSDATLLDRTPVEASFAGYPMSQFDKDDVEDLGLLKLDVLGIRMQSSMAYAVAEVERVEGEVIDLDSVSLEDPASYALIGQGSTLGCFQIESPGQRELIGKFAPRSFDDIIIDISLFRPGPVKSDMITPFLEDRHGWRPRRRLHPALDRHLEETGGVVVFHEQVLTLIAELSGCDLARADEVRRTLGDRDTRDDVRDWLLPAARARGFPDEVAREMWEVLAAFGSFGFCKAHAAAFALTTFHSVWLKAHHPAAFLAGVLTHDPGMYPKRLVLDEARRLGIEILGVDVNRSRADYRVERVGTELPRAAVGRPGAAALGSSAPDLRRDPRAFGTSVIDRSPGGAGGDPIERRSDSGRSDAARSVSRVSDAARFRSGADPPRPADGLPLTGHGYGIRLGLADVKGINETEIGRVVAGQPYVSLADFWRRTGVSQPVAEHLILTGGLDRLHGIHPGSAVGRRGQVTRRDLLLALTDLRREARVDAGAARRPGRGSAPVRVRAEPSAPGGADPALGP